MVEQQAHLLRKSRLQSKQLFVSINSFQLLGFLQTLKEKCRLITLFRIEPATLLKAN